MSEQPTSDKAEGQVEDWMDIPGFPGYQASSLGRIRSCRPAGRGKAMSPWRILRTHRAGKGYRGISLFRNKIAHHRYVHRLVLEAFIGPCPSGLEARHVCENDRTDNRLRNLCWGTKAENQADRKRHGTQTVGEQCYAAKLTAEGVRELLELRAGGETLMGLAKKFGIRYENVRHICQGKHWKHLGLPLPDVDCRFKR